MSRYVSEDEAEDYKRQAWEEKHGIDGSDPHIRPCPECDGDLVLIERYKSSRIVRGSELWECKCGHSEEGWYDG